jgi:hypothetical protein
MVTKMDMDLNLANYSVEDLLSLFKLDGFDLNEAAMKKAKTVVHRVHPDKSGLDAKYFVFYSSAYRLLEQVSDFQDHTSSARRKESAYEYSAENVAAKATQPPPPRAPHSDSTCNRSGAPRHHQTAGGGGGGGGNNPNKNFNLADFNRLFEEVQAETSDGNTGHGDWFKSEEGFVDTGSAKSLKEAHSNLDAIKEKMFAGTMTVRQEVQPFVTGGSMGSYLSGRGNLNQMGMDLKDAYTKTLIAGSEDDLRDMPQYKNAQEYAAHREAAQYTAMNEADSEAYFARERKQQEGDATQLGFKLARDIERAEKAQERLGAQFRLLN